MMNRSASPAAASRVSGDAAPPGVGTPNATPPFAGGHVVAILALLLMAWALRLTIFEQHQLGEDGYLSIGLARLDVDQALAYFLRDIHPPLFYLILGRWTEWLGPSFLVARWLPLACGMVSAALLVSIVRRVLGREAAVIGLTLYAFAPAAILQAATVRDYSLGTALSLLSWRLLIGPVKTPGTLAALGLVSASALAVWYFHLCSLPLQLGYAWFRRRTALLPLVTGSVVMLPWLVGVVFAWIPRWGTERLGAITPFQSDQSAHVVYLAGAGRSLLGDLPFSPGLVLALAWLLLVGGGLVQLVRMRMSGLAIVLLGGSGLGFLATVAISLSWGGPDFVPRYFLVVLLYGIPAVAALLGSQQRALGRSLASAVVVLPGVVFVASFYELRTDAGPRAILARSLEPRLGANDLVVFDNLEDHGYFWLANRSGAATIALHTFGIGPWSDHDPERTVARATGQPFRTVWWVHHELNEDQVARALEARLISRRFVTAGDQIAHWIAKETVLPTPTKEVGAAFQGGIRLASAQFPQRAETCRRFPVVTFWRTERLPLDDLTFFVHVLDQSGKRVAQNDGPPFAGHGSAGIRSSEPIPDVRWITFTPTTAPGPYTVQIGLYDDHGNLTLANGADRLGVGTVELSNTCLSAERQGAEPGGSRSR